MEASMPIRVVEGRTWLDDARRIHEDELPGNHRGFWAGDFGPFGRLLVAEVGGEVVGYLLGEIVVAVNRFAVVHELATRHTHRRKGVGTALLCRFAELAIEAAVGYVYIKPIPGERRQALMGFYARRGFTKKPVEQDHQRAPAARIIRAARCASPD